MDLSSQIKKLRARDGFSQDALANRIYVTRQTVSNWETGKSYPDVHNLLALSILFNVSLDELIKGDIEMMKNELDVYRMKLWTGIVMASCAVSIFIALPLQRAFGLPGLIPSVILFALGLTVSIKLERLKKKHNVKTYAEILAFMEGRATNANPVQTPGERKHQGLSTPLKLICGATVGLVLFLISLFIWTVLLN